MAVQNYFHNLFNNPYPLGLPRGTVRALITIIISITIWYLLFVNQIAMEYFLTSDIVALTFYFGYRRGVPAKIIEQDITRAEQAFGLPATVVRGFILLGFILVGIALSIQNNYPDQLNTIYTILIAYFVADFINRFRKRGKKRENDVLDHLIALIALLGSLSICIIIVIFQTQITNNTSVLLNISINYWIFVLNVIVGYYFGGRG